MESEHESSRVARMYTGFDVLICTPNVAGQDNGLIVIGQGHGLDQAIAAVPVTDEFGSNLHYDGNGMPAHDVTRWNGNLEFYLKTPDGLDVDLNDYEWGMQILLQY